MGVSSQERAVDAWMMGLERSHRAPSAGERARQLYMDGESRRLAAQDWCRVNLPDLNLPDGSVCVFTAASALAVRDRFPGLTGDEYRVRVRSWRAGWLERLGLSDDPAVQPAVGEVAA